MKRILTVTAMLLAALTCMGFSSSEKDKLQAENRIMKRNLDLALRENSVLGNENRQLKAEVKKLNKTASKLDADLKASKTRHEKEMAAANERHEALKHAHILMAEENQRTIDELTARNETLATEKAEEAARLKKRLAEQKSAFKAEREGMTARFAEMEKDYAGRIDVLKTEVKEKSASIKDYTVQIAALNTDLAARDAALSEMSQQLAVFEADLNEKAAANEECVRRETALQAELKDKSAALADTEKNFKESGGKLVACEDTVQKQKARIDALEASAASPAGEKHNPEQP